MQKTTSKAAKCISIIILIAFSMFIIAFGIEFYRGKDPVITTSLSDYRVVTGNLNNDDPQSIIDSFFPSVIEDHYSMPNYYFRGQRIDSYACEAYFDFMIDDVQKFDEHYQSLMKYGSPQSAYFAPQYDMWLVNDHMYLSEAMQRTSTGDVQFSIDAANLGVILCNKEQHHFIYCAILVEDGGSATTGDLSHFFEKFNIYPYKFVKTYSLDSRS